MAEDRLRPAGDAEDDEVHDDDELAEVLAAELERYATGAVPVVGRTPPPPAPTPTSTPAPAPAPAPTPAPRPLLRPVERRAQPPTPVEPVLAVEPEESVEPDSSAFSRRAARVQQEYGGGAGAFRRPADGPPVERRPTGETDTAPSAIADSFSGGPLRRRSGFRPPASEAPLPPTDPIDRVLPTGPIALPEATGALLGSMIADSAPQTAAKHAAPPPEPVGPLPSPASLDLPGGLYSDWEQSLRSIGRPRPAWDDDSPMTGGAPADAPTMAVPVPATSPATKAAPSAETPAAPPAAAPPAELAVDEEPPDDRATGADGDTPRRGRRRAVPAPEPAPVGARMPAPQATPDTAARDGDEEGIDEVVVDYPEVRAATTGAIDLPAVESRPRTGPVLMERVRTAILQLPTVSASASGSGAAAVAGRWIGAFASPLALVLGFGLAAAGAGPAALVAVLAGVVLAVPAAGRSAAWAAEAGSRGDRLSLETDVLGVAAGRVAAGVLLAARLAAVVLLLFTVGDLAGAFVARTGVAGGSATTASVAAALIVGLVATAVALGPPRVVGVLVLLAGAVGVLVTASLLLLLGTGGDAPPAGSIAAAVGSGAAGFSGIGLLLVLAVADTIRWRTDVPRARSSAVAAAVGAALGGAVLVGALLVAVRFGPSGDPVSAIVTALVDATAEPLALPLAVALLAASVTLPAVLLRSSGAAAVRLTGGGAVVLGTTSAGLLAVAGALGLAAAGAELPAVAVAIAGIAGVPVAAWAGLLTVAPIGAPGRRRVATIAAVVGTVIGWLLCDGLLPGLSSPVLDVLGAQGAGRGGPAAGLAAAFAFGLLGGALTGRRSADAPRRSVDSVTA